MRKYIIWTRQLSVGDEILDGHHVEIFGILNKIYNSIPEEQPIQMKRIWEKLEAYSEKHFSYEEKVMEEIGYPDAERHIKAHRAYISRIKELWSGNYADEAGGIDEIFQFLKRWWKKHIQEMDQHYSGYLDN